MTGRRQLSLCVFVDALGWQLVQQYPFLDTLLTTKAPLNTIFGYSSTCDPTILTGTLPREHGHFTFFYYNPRQSPFRFYRPLGLLPKSITSRGRVRSKLSQIMQPLHGYTGYFQLYNMPFRYLHLFDYSEKRDLYQPGGINSGAPTIFDFLRERQIPFSLPNWRLCEPARFAALEADIERGNVVFAYLFLGILDAILHGRGTQAPQVAEHLRWCESQLMHIVELARHHYNTVRLFVFSDHGMADITATCDLMRRVNALGLRFGTDYAAVYDSTMARFWFLNPAARDAIASVLEREPQGRIVSETQLHEWGVDFPGHRYGELFFLMEPGVLLCPSFMGEKPLAAMHGYAPEHRDSIASFMTNVTVNPLPQRLDDLYGLMRTEVESAWEAR